MSQLFSGKDSFRRLIQPFFMFLFLIPFTIQQQCIIHTPSIYPLNPFYELITLRFNPNRSLGRDKP